MKTFNCPRCDLDFYEGKFCRTCGIFLVPMPEVFCECGKALSKMDRYCRWCGKPVNKA
uniref:DZANK-type domain-containing protein n=1 Tax=viral metagenome TaxID=1070528 RepID=A0A6M3LNW7_9ZZZZ